MTAPGTTEEDHKRPSGCASCHGLRKHRAEIAGTEAAGRSPGSRRADGSAGHQRSPGTQPSDVPGRSPQQLSTRSHQTHKEPTGAADTSVYKASLDELKTLESRTIFSDHNRTRNQ